MNSYVRSQLRARIGHALFVLQHQHLLAREGRPQAQQLVGVDAAVEGGVGGGARRGTDREAVLGQRAPGAEALDGVAQQHQQARLGRGLAQQGRRPGVEHVARRPLARRGGPRAARRAGW